MKRRLFFILLVFAGCLNVSAQFARTDNMVERRLSILQREIAPLYRKPTKKELQEVAPRPELAEKFADFLRHSNTGLTKLVKDKGCADNTKVVRASDDCLKYTMPGAGSSFSFRTQNYRLPRLADITLTDNSFQASGIFLHGIFVNIGDVPLDKVTTATDGLKYLFDFVPEPDYEKGKELAQRLTQGIRQDGFLYRRGLYVVENTTFVLRSIAYEGKYFRAVRGITYNELEFDKRKDITVAFRIVEKDADGNVTILWKELREQDAPRMKFKEKLKSKEILP